MQGLGLTREDFKEEISAEVFPDNWLAVRIFDDLSTQWRVGMNGPTGLDYGVIPAVLRARGIPRKEWNTIFDAIRVMEPVALQEIHRP